MCLILCAYKSHPRYDLVIAANRDEFLARPTAGAAWWEDSPAVLAGRDLEQMGTWLGCTADGRFAAVTNYREPSKPRRDAPSRGQLVRDFLEGKSATGAFLGRLRRRGERYNGYNLLFGTVDRLAYHSNRDGEGGLLAPGVHGVSNHLLDTPWPKVVNGKRVFSSLLERYPDELPVEELFRLLSDRTIAPDNELPDTGVPIELERMLSPIFTAGEEYGTRCSTVVAVDRAGSVFFEERDVTGRPPARYSFDLPYRRNQGRKRDRS